MIATVKVAALAALSVVVVLATLSSTACVGSPTATTTSAPFSQTDVTVGTGTAAASGNTLVVTYTGYLFDSSQPSGQGAQFDTSSDYSFALGKGVVIAGWDQGLIGMKVGGRRRLVVPPSLAYGDTRHGPIPPNATLLFDITLISVQ
jgi:FKBP-type peptidyl-prolyl cis-trans isomerase FkpA